jgi:uncharacterized membrane protein YdjX (TVP38/TMEM64 family)
MKSEASSALRFTLFILVLAFLWYLGRFYHLDTARIQEVLRQIPLVYSGLLYILLYVTVTFFLFFSKDLFWLMGALLFGPAFSALFISCAEITNAAILFNLSRILGRRYVEDSLQRRNARLDKKLGSLNFFWLFLLRVAPLVPYRFLDLAAGLTPLSFKKYMAAVVFGSPLKIVWIQYILAAMGKSVLDNPAALGDYFLRNTHLFWLSCFYLAAVIAVAIKMGKKG